jgi:WD40 repeat protein
VLQTLEGHSDLVKSVVFSPDGKQVASGSYDETVRLWDSVTGAALQTLEGHSDTVMGATLQSLEGKLNLTLSVAKDWVVEGGERILWLPPDYRPTCYAVSNKAVVLGRSSGKLSFLNFKEGLKLMQEQQRLEYVL